MNMDSHPFVLLDEQKNLDSLCFRPSNSRVDDASSVLIAPNSSSSNTLPPPSTIVEQAMNVDKASSSSMYKIKMRIHPVMWKKMLQIGGYWDRK